MLSHDLIQATYDLFNDAIFVERLLE